MSRLVYLVSYVVKFWFVDILAVFRSFPQTPRQANHRLDQKTSIANKVIFLSCYFSLSLSLPLSLSSGLKLTT